MKKPQEKYAVEESKFFIIDSELKINIEDTIGEEIECLYYDNGHPKSITYLKGEILHGPSTFLNIEGKILSQSWFVNGVIEGKSFEFYHSGQVSSIQRFKNGLRVGLQEYFYPDGSLKSIIPYKKGHIDGNVQLFEPTGAIKRDLQYVKGVRKEG